MSVIGDNQITQAKPVLERQMCVFPPIHDSYSVITHVHRNDMKVKVKLCEQREPVEGERHGKVFSMCDLYLMKR